MNSNRDVKQREQVLQQNILFSFSSGVFMKTSMLLSLLFSGEKFSDKLLAIQVLISSISDASGDAYSLAMANASSNLSTFDMGSLTEFIYSFLAKSSVGIIHLILYLIGFKSSTISAIDIITYIGLIIMTTLLILEKQYNKEMDYRKHLRIILQMIIIGILLIGFVVGLSNIITTRL
jgi:hypothetical protein